MHNIQAMREALIDAHTIAAGLKPPQVWFTRNEVDGLVDAALASAPVEQPVATVYSTSAQSPHGERLLKWHVPELPVGTKLYAHPQGGVALDAARYRWLTENSAFGETIGGDTELTMTFSTDAPDNIGDLDAAIDSAITAIAAQGAPK